LVSAGTKGEYSLTEDFTESYNNNLEFHYTTELNELIKSTIEIWAAVIRTLIMFSFFASLALGLAGFLYTNLS
jgi:hypothetical protein